MFLSSMRSGVFSGFFLAILVLGGVGLILSDRGNFFHDGVGKTDVIKIDGHSIKTAEFDRIVRSQLQGQSLSTSDAYKAGFIDRIVQNEVMSRLLRKTAFDLGIIADDKTVANQLRKALEPMTSAGANAKEALNKVLQAQGISEKNLVESMRNDISTNLLRLTIGGGVYVPESMTKAFYEWNLEERAISYVSLPNSAIKIDPPSDAALARFYDTIKSEYMIPETRNVTVGIVDISSLVSKTEVIDEKIKEFYDSNKKDFETAETRTLEQAVLKTEKEANDVLATAKTSKNLKDAVSKVTGKTEAYSEGNAFEEKALPEQLAKPVFEADLNNFVGPIQTPLGWHVFYVEKINEAGVKSFDSVKTQIKRELTETGNSDAQFAITNEIEDRLSGGEGLATMAEEYKIKTIPLKNITSATTKSDALNAYDKDQAKILQTAFSTNENESSPLSEISGGKMFTVHVEKVSPAKAKDLKEIKAEVLDKWTALEKRRKLLVKALEITQSLDEKKKTLADIAKEYGANIKTAKIVRGNTAPAGFNQQSIGQIMTADTAKAIAVPDISSIQIVKIDKVLLPEKKPTESELANIEKNLSLDLQEERFVSFINHVERNSKVVVNKDLIDRMYGQQATEQ